MTSKLLATAMAASFAAAVGFSAPAQAAPHPSCWGQATQVFAQTGAMGEHSSSQANPRSGLRNLARALAEAGVIEDHSMADLGVFVSSDLGLSIDACQ